MVKAGCDVFVVVASNTSAPCSRSAPDDDVVLAAFTFRRDDRFVLDVFVRLWLSSGRLISRRASCRRPGRPTWAPRRCGSRQHDLLGTGVVLAAPPRLEIHQGRVLGQPRQRVGVDQIEVQPRTAGVRYGSISLRHAPSHSAACPETITRSSLAPITPIRKPQIEQSIAPSLEVVGFTVEGQSRSLRQPHDVVVTHDDVHGSRSLEAHARRALVLTGAPA